MIVLDTNVLSEALKPLPSGIVLRWLTTQEPSAVFTTTITQAEVFYGVEALAPSVRRTRLLAAVERMFVEEFEDRILPFDGHAARTFAKIVAARDAVGRPISQFDAMIAAIAQSHHSAVATRNPGDFEGCGVDVVNPWSGE